MLATAPVNAPRDVAEEVGLEQVGRHRAELTVTNGRARARRVRVDRARDELLAGAALALDEDRRPRGPGQADELEDLAHPLGLADDAPEAEALRELLAQAPVLLGQPARLGALARRSAALPRSGRAWGCSGRRPRASPRSRPRSRSTRSRSRRRRPDRAGGSRAAPRGPGGRAASGRAGRRRGARPRTGPRASAGGRRPP